MNKLRTIIRLYEDRTGLKTIADMTQTSRNTVKKYVAKWNSLDLSYDEFLSKSDAELYELFCVNEEQSEPNPRMEALEAFLPSVVKEMGRKGMTGQKQWERYIAAHPDGYSRSQFNSSLRILSTLPSPSLLCTSTTRLAIRCISTSPEVNCKLPNVMEPSVT